MPGTTIHVSQKTKDRLGALKVHPRETYEDVIVRLIDFYERFRDVVGSVGEKAGEEKGEIVFEGER